MSIRIFLCLWYFKLINIRVGQTKIRTEQRAHLVAAVWCIQFKYSIAYRIYSLFFNCLWITNECKWSFYYCCCRRPLLIPFIFSRDTLLGRLVFIARIHICSSSNVCIVVVFILCVESLECECDRVYFAVCWFFVTIFFSCFVLFIITLIKT